MKRAFWLAILTLAMLVGLFTVFSGTVSAAPGPDVHSAFGPGAVFAMTNADASNGGNMVAMYNRHADGTLSMVGLFPTNGNGYDVAPPDPLGSQGSLMLTPDGKWLIAANAGSNDITVFRVKQNGLDIVEKVSSGGMMPVSLTISDNEVFVLNNGTPNITGFKLMDNGHLDPISGSARLLPAGGAFAQVGFDNKGNWLVVTDKANNNILVYAMKHDQMPAMNPVISPSNSPVPFGFFFDDHDNLFVVDVNPPTFNGAVSSYNIERDGTLDANGAPVYNGQAAACWIVGNEMGDLFTTNPHSSSISAYREKGSSGKVKLMDATAASGVTTIDEGISNDGEYLYALAPGVGVDGFKIGHDGTLTILGTFGSGFAGYAQGIAVR